MGKVYLVTSGYYSDYGIHAIYDDRDLAEVYVTTFDKDTENLKIEEYELNPYQNGLKPADGAKLCRKFFIVEMDIKGNVISVDEVAYDGEPSGIFFYSYSKSMFCNCFATDGKHAVKIANEKRIQSLSSNMFGE
jgi:hypothetical protein